MMLPRLRAAVIAIHKRGEYPSGSAVLKELGRGGKLSGDETKVRRETTRELGITMLARGGRK